MQHFDTFKHKVVTHLQVYFNLYLLAVVYAVSLWIDAVVVRVVSLWIDAVVRVVSLWIDAVVCVVSLWIDAVVAAKDKESASVVTHSQFITA